MNRYFAFFALVLFVTFTSCKPSRDKSEGEIRKLEERVYSQHSFTFNKPTADTLLKLYNDFITRFPSDTLAPVYLFRSANLVMTEGDGNQALALLDRFITTYPDHPKAPVCAFFKGYVCENILKDLVKARENYMAYMEKYPNDVFVKDARLSVKNLGKTPDEIVKEFEEQQRQDSIRRADSMAALKSGKSYN